MVVALVADLAGTEDRLQRDHDVLLETAKK
jgi:hypothetical protein